MNQLNAAQPTQVFAQSSIRNLRVLVAPSGFKESLAADEVADCIEAGILQAMPHAKVFKAPLVDGGEGFAQALVAATQGTLYEVEVTGPVGEPVVAHFGFLGNSKTAVMEMASAAGLRLVPRDLRDPTRTTSYGVGELIKAALDAGATRILLGCGDSGICDGGAGMAQALGVQMLDKSGKEIGRGGTELYHLERLDFSNLDPRLANVQIDAAVNWHNLLLGERGVARVFGPQKGATPEQVHALELALLNYANIIFEQLGLDIATAPGSGASGGLGAGLAALLGATLHPRYDIVMQYLEIDSLLAQADLVITAEGGIDYQTPRGKIPAEVARRAAEYGLPVIALAGTVGEGASINHQHGIHAYMSILERPSSLEEAIEQARDLTTQAAEQVARTLMVGYGLSLHRPF